MALLKKFWRTWQKEFGIASASLCSLILLGVEKIMELEFKCPPSHYWKVRYSLCYFLIPAMVLFLLSLAFQPQCPNSVMGCCNIHCLGKTFLPSIIWTVILLLDGRYVACLCKASEETITADNKEQPSDSYIISQISGLGITLGIVVILFICKKCSECRERERNRENPRSPDPQGIELPRRRVDQSSPTNDPDSTLQEQPFLGSPARHQARRKRAPSKCENLGEGWEATDADVRKSLNHRDCPHKIRTSDHPSTEWKGTESGLGGIQRRGA
ncbi:unnamed protein product [Natator depressus]